MKTKDEGLLELVIFVRRVLAVGLLLVCILAAMVVVGIIALPLILWELTGSPWWMTAYAVLLIPLLTADAELMKKAEAQDVEKNM